jgi:hypothetical protein
MTQTNEKQTLAHGHHGRLEDLIEKGNPLHDRAVADFFMRWLPAAILSMTKAATHSLSGKSIAGRRGSMSLTHSHRAVG